MLSNHETFRFAEKGTGKEFSCEVNWNGNDGCAKVRFTFPNGDKVVVDRNQLNTMLFAMGNRTDQMKMIPSVESRSRWYSTVVGVKNTTGKPIMPGQEVIFPLKLSLPTFSEEVYAEAKKDVLKTTSPLIG